LKQLICFQHLGKCINLQNYELMLFYFRLPDSFSDHPEGVDGGLTGILPDGEYRLQIKSRRKGYSLIIPSQTPKRCLKN